MGNIDVIYKERENDHLPESPNRFEFIAIAVHHKQSLQPAAERAHYS